MVSFLLCQYSKYSAGALAGFATSIYYNLHVMIVVLIMGSFGALICPIVAIILEETIYILPPELLLVGSVSLRICTSLYAAVVAQLFGIYFNTKTRQKGLLMMGYLISSYVFVFLVVLIALPSYKRK